MDKDGSVSRQPGLAVALVLVVLAVAVVGAGMLAMSIVAPFAFTLGLKPALLISETALVGPGLLAVAAFRRHPSVSLGLEPIGSRTALVVAAAAVPLWVASLGLFEIQYALWAPPPGYLEGFERLHDALRPQGPVDALVSVFAIAVVPAICEELLLRGIVLPALRTALGTGLAVVASAALFALIHWDLYRAAFTFTL